MASDACDCMSQYSCNGCNQVRVCSPCPGGGFHEILSVNCTGSTPYCKEGSGTCTAIMPEECAPLSENVICMKENGIFPDKLNCSHYHVCKNYTAYSFSCNRGNFNTKTNECDSLGVCSTVNCHQNVDPRKIANPNHRNLYGYCHDNDLIFIDRCPANYELNEASQECEVVCREEGFLPDSADRSKFYVCTGDATAGTLSAHSKQCPRGSVFDRDYQQCTTL